MRQSLVSLLALATLAGAASAQTINAPGPGQARFAYNTGATPTSSTFSGAGSANLDVNGAATGGDSLFATWWHYRVDNDAREFTYHAPANPFVAAGDTMTGTFNLPSAAPSFRSELNYKIIDTDGAATNQALLQIRNKVTNTSSVSRTINIYSYTDFDPNGSFSHPYSYNGTEQALTGSSGGVTFWFKGFGANAYAANDFDLLRDELDDAGVDNLNNTVVYDPTTPGSGDFTGAFQWTFTLAPGEMTEILSVLSINTLPVPAPGAAGLVGLVAIAGLRRRR